MTNKKSILFRSLLPELASDGVVFSWQESQLRDLDWSEKDLYGLVPVFVFKSILRTIVIFFNFALLFVGM